jgi:hypothetical protein
VAKDKTRYDRGMGKERVDTFSLASPPCHRHRRRHRHRPPHDICIPSPFFLRQIESCHPLPPIPMTDCVFWGGVGRDTTLRPRRRKPTIRQLLIVLCSSSVDSDETPAPPLQESLHRDGDVGGGRIGMPPPPRATAAPATYPAPRRGSSFSSSPRCSCHAEPRRSAT